MQNQLSPSTYKRILQFQRDEISGSILYRYIAEHQREESNKTALLEIAKEEYTHYETWRKYTGRDVRPSWFKITLGKITSRILGDTFTIKFFEKSEDFGLKKFNAKGFRAIEEEIPEVGAILQQEDEHENRLMAMVDEERLHYVGAMVLGLNDALVELTGAVAGFTFALANTGLVALSAIITGVSATLSMAASNYLAERANGNAKAIKSSMYTGMAYLITVALMVLPYLLLPDKMYIAAFAIMLAIVVLIILLFNFYISLAQDLPFLRRFGEMAVISLSVAAISFVIGMLAKSILGIDV